MHWTSRLQIITTRDQITTDYHHLGLQCVELWLVLKISVSPQSLTFNGLESTRSDDKQCWLTCTYMYNWKCVTTGYTTQHTILTVYATCHNAILSVDYSHFLMFRLQHVVNGQWLGYISIIAKLLMAKLHVHVLITIHREKYSGTRRQCTCSEARLHEY